MLGILPLLCKSCHSSHLPGSNRRIGRRESIGASYIPEQQHPTLPRNQNDAIRTFPILTIEARWFQTSGIFDADRALCTISFKVDDSNAGSHSNDSKANVWQHSPPLQNKDGNYEVYIWGHPNGGPLPP